MSGMRISRRIKSGGWFLAALGYERLSFSKKLMRKKSLPSDQQPVTRCRVCRQRQSRPQAKVRVSLVSTVMSNKSIPSGRLEKCGLLLCNENWHRSAKQIIRCGWQICHYLPLNPDCDSSGHLWRFVAFCRQNLYLSCFADDN